ncbi:hypothetical protein JZ751_021888, partial [Albula glossodonta]
MALNTTTAVLSLSPAGMPLSLDCKAFFGYSGESRPIIYWMKGEKFVEELEGHIKESEVRRRHVPMAPSLRMSDKSRSGSLGGRSHQSAAVTTGGCSLTLRLPKCFLPPRVLREYLGEKEVELSLTFDTVEEDDMGNYTCYVENHIGRKHGSAILQKRDMRRLELAGAFGVVVLLLGLLTAVYKCNKVELVLCYRKHFGKSEAERDNKEYDAALCYTKVDLGLLEHDSTEEEQFALEVLPDVLEKHYGYKLFIPDRDLIHSSAYIEDLVRSVEQSRRIIIVLTPSFVAKRGWSIFQLEARLHSMLVTGEIKVIMIECSDLRRVINYQEVEALKHTIKLLSMVKWRGPKDNQLTSKFWKRVLCEMPVRKKESLSRRQILDSGEQGLFADLQSISTIAMTTTSASLAPTHTKIPKFDQMNHMQVKHYCRSYDFDKGPTPVRVATLGNRHMYCNIPMTLLNGQVGQQHSSTVKSRSEILFNRRFIPLSTEGLTSDI